MVFPVAAAAARRRVGMIARQQVQRRTMAGGHGAAPEWQGIDKIVRGVFPADYQLAMAIMGGYFGLFVISKGISSMGGKKKAEEPASAPATSSDQSTGIPPVDSPEFDKFLGSEAFEKLLNSDEQLSKLLADMK